MKNDEIFANAVEQTAVYKNSIEMIVYEMDDIRP